MATSLQPQPPPAESAIRMELERILASGTFSRSKRLSEFLRFIVEQTLVGKGADLKEQVLATELYKKGADFDTAVDAVVRVDARRLRDKLREYYAEFPQDPIVISLPKGGYAPAFEWTLVPVPAAASAQVRWKSPAVAAASLILILAGVYFFLRERTTLPESASVAVLPLESLSADANQEYLADGLTDALITDLAKIKALRVISRTSVLRFKRTKEPIGKIAKALGVDYLVEGTILPSAGRIRMTAQLIAANNERHIWAENYERNQTDVLSLQSEIARSVATQIRIRLTPEDQARLKPAQAPDPEAVQDYLKGRYQWNKRTPEGLKMSLAYLKAAVQKDPNYALAWAALSDSYSLLANYNLVPAQEAFPLGRAAAQRALQLDDTLAEAHAALANTADDPSSAEPEFARAVELNPNYVTARQWHAENLMFLGRTEEALAEMNRALELDPLSPLMHAVRAKISYYAGHYDEAVREDRQAIEMEPGVGGPGTRVILSLAYARQGRYSAAISELKSAGAASGESQELGSPELTAILGYVYVRGGERQKAELVLTRLRHISRVDPYAMVSVNAALGNREEAFAWLNQAYSARDNLIYMLKVDPDVDSLRSDPRFGELLKKLKL